jgi:hypothetical protein
LPHATVFCLLFTSTDGQRGGLSFVDAENALCYSIIARTGFHIITIFSLWTTDALF